MRVFAPILAVALVITTAPIALAHGEGTAVAHTHMTVMAANYIAVFHLEAPDAPVYACPMHPAETASKPFTTCPACKMELELQTHLIGIAIAGAKGALVQDAAVTLDVTSEGGMTQSLALAPSETVSKGAFVLHRGSYELVAHVKRPNQDEITFKTAYVVK